MINIFYPIDFNELGKLIKKKLIFAQEIFLPFAKFSNKKQILITITDNILMRRKKKVILVEDNQADIELVKIAFDELSTPIELLHFYNGHDLMKHLQTQSVHDIALILLDLNMPKMGGIDVLRAFQKQEHLLRIPVIVLSSSLREADIKICYNLGANGYVNKPLDIDYFYKMIQSIVSYWLETNLYVDFIETKTKILKP